MDSLEKESCVFATRKVSRKNLALEGAGGMVHWLGTRPALPEDLGLILGLYTVVCNSLPGSTGSGHTCGAQTYM